jgi:hypothetical protein
MLRDPVPALVAAARADGDLPVARPRAADRRLDLDPDKATVQLGDQVVVGRPEERGEDIPALARTPLDGGRLAEITLYAWVDGPTLRRAV